MRHGISLLTFFTNKSHRGKSPQGALIMNKVLALFAAALFVVAASNVVFANDPAPTGVTGATGVTGTTGEVAPTGSVSE
jgi:hypothetical protein